MTRFFHKVFPRGIDGAVPGLGCPPAAGGHLSPPSRSRRRCPDRGFTDDDEPHGRWQHRHLGAPRQLGMGLEMPLLLFHVKLSIIVVHFSTEVKRPSGLKREIVISPIPVTFAATSTSATAATAATAHVIQPRSDYRVRRPV